MDDNQTTLPQVTRDELIKMVARAHGDCPYAEASLAGKTLAAQSRLPRVIAENLGAGFGQWDFFPEPTEIVDFAFGYVPPQSAEDVWTIARAWASDDAASRQTLMALVGREILKHELRRIDVPPLRELVEETRANREHALRTTLGLEAPATRAAAPAPAPPTDAPQPERKARARREPADPARPIPTRMPKPEFVRPPKAAPPPPPKRFVHPKFGEGVLEGQQGVGEDAKLTIKFASGSKTLLARFVTEL